MSLPINLTGFTTVTVQPNRLRASARCWEVEAGESDPINRIEEGGDFTCSTRMSNRSYGIEETTKVMDKRALISH